MKKLGFVTIPLIIFSTIILFNNQWRTFRAVKASPNVLAWREIGDNSNSGGGVSQNALDSKSPTMAISPDNRIIIAWPDNSSGNYEIYVKQWLGDRWGDIGSGSSSGGGISNNAGTSLNPAIGFGAGGEILVAWHDDTSGNNEIYIKKYISGQWQVVGSNSATGGGISDTPYDSTKPWIAVSPGNGWIYVAWEDEYEHDNSATDAQIYMKRFDGSSWDEFGVTNSASTGGVSDNDTDSRRPHIAFSPTSLLYLTWHDFQPGNTEIYLLRLRVNEWEEVGGSSASGGGISNSSGKSMQPAISFLPQAVAGFPTRTPCVTWRDEVSGDSEIYMRCLEDETSWEPIGTNSASGGGISNTTGSSKWPTIAYDSNGKIYVSWFETGTSDSEIYIKMFENGNWVEVGDQSASGGGISNNVGESVSPMVIVSNEGIPVVAWTDTSGVDNEIYAVQYANESEAPIPLTTATTLFLPSISNKYVTCYEGADEGEDNDETLQATGILCSGQTINGIANDTWDIFTYSHLEDGPISLNLNGFNPPGGELILYEGVPSAATERRRISSSPYEINYNGNSGLYYIAIFIPGTSPPNTPYTLTVSSP